MAINQVRPDTPLANTPDIRFAQDTIKPKVIDKRQQNKIDIAAKKEAYAKRMEGLKVAGKQKVEAYKVKDSVGYASRSKNSGISVEDLKKNDQKLKEKMAKKDDAVDEGSVKCGTDFKATKCGISKAAAKQSKKDWKTK
jgi:hypothetical protein